MLKKLFEQSGFVLALSVIDATLFFSAASRPREKILEAEQIILRGRDGSIKGVWGENPEPKRGRS